MQEPHTKGPFNYAFHTNCTATLKHMWTMWWSKLELKINSYLTLRNFQQFKKVQMEAQINGMRIRCTVWKTTRFHSEPPRNWSKSGEDQSHHGYGSSSRHQRHIEAQGLHGSPTQICFQAWRTGPSLLQATQAKRQVLLDTESSRSTWRSEAPPPDSANRLILNASSLGENLLFYIVATTHVINTAIMVERPEECHAYGVQRPVYFISEVLSESKVIYPSIQKILYAILITSRKLRHYFDEYKVTVVTEFPLADILHNRDATGCISKWAVELGALEIKFQPKTAIKSQALVDFLAEWREN